MADYHWDGPLDAYPAGTNQLDSSLICPSQAFWKPRVTRCKYSHLSEAPTDESGPTRSSVRWHHTVESPGGEKDRYPQQPSRGAKKQNSDICLYWIYGKPSSRLMSVMQWEVLVMVTKLLNIVWKFSSDTSCRFITHLPLLPRQHVVGSGEQISVDIVQYEPEYCTRIKYW